METIKQWISSIDINRLLTIFDIQIAIGIVIFFFVFRTVFTKLIIKIYYKLIKSSRSHKESSMYKVLNGFFIVLGLYVSIKILNKNAQMEYFADKIFQIAAAYCITKAISSQLFVDSLLLRKTFKEENKAVDKLICKVLRVLLWIIFFFVV